MSSFAKLKLPGQLLLGNSSIRVKSQERLITFKKIVGLLENNKLKKPEYQTVLDEDKVTEMIKSYKKNKEFLIFKNKIVIGVIPDYLSKIDDNYTMYVIDGQHRIEMAKQILEEGENDHLIFCYYEINTDKEMKKLFLEINKDSYKNSKYVTLNEFNQNIYDEFKKYLHDDKRLRFFSQKKNKNNNIYSTSEFLDLLVDRKYIEMFKHQKDLINDFENKNKIFYRKLDYKEYLNDDKDCFYEDEKPLIINEYICAMKNNNFIDFLLNDKIIPDHHKFKKMKDVIHPTLRIRVWDHWYGKEDTGPCPICNKLIKIGKNGFHCGHIISEANGGKTIIDNLRPICASCNLKMGSTNWNDYEKLLSNVVNKT